jgi:hypothetical protein
MNTNVAKVGQVYWKAEKVVGDKVLLKQEYQRIKTQ